MRCLHSSDFAPNAGRLRQGHGVLIKDSYATVWSGVEPGMSAVVQAETWGLMPRFGLFTSPTNNILEERTPDICPFADMFVIQRQRST